MLPLWPSADRILILPREKGSELRLIEIDLPPSARA
jgi:hypothetical protein